MPRPLEAELSPEERPARVEAAQRGKGKPWECVNPPLDVTLKRRKVQSIYWSKFSLADPLWQMIRERLSVTPEQVSISLRDLPFFDISRCKALRRRGPL
jgi:hypothetical protein